jgi:hypothetical protein
MNFLYFYIQRFFNYYLVKDIVAALLKHRLKFDGFDLIKNLCLVAIWLAMRSKALSYRLKQTLLSCT